MLYLSLFQKISKKDNNITIYKYTGKTREISYDGKESFGGFEKIDLNRFIQEHRV